MAFFQTETSVLWCANDKEEANYRKKYGYKLENCSVEIYSNVHIWYMRHLLFGVSDVPDHLL